MRQIVVIVVVGRALSGLFTRYWFLSLSRCTTVPLSPSLPQSLSPSPSPSPSASQFLSPCLFVRFIILLWCNHLSCSKATNTHSAFIQLFNSYGHIVIESYSRIVIVYGVYIDLPRHATKFRQTWIANAIFRFIMLTRWVGKWTKLYTRCVYISTPPSLPTPSRSSAPLCLWLPQLIMCSNSFGQLRLQLEIAQVSI